MRFREVLIKPVFLMPPYQETDAPGLRWSCEPQFPAIHSFLRTDIAQRD